MKKLIAIALFASLCLAVCSCKKDEEIKPEKVPETEVTQEAQHEVEAEKEPAIEVVEEETNPAFVKDIPALISEFGAQMSAEETPFYADAESLAAAVMAKDSEAIAGFTGGQGVYYDFLSDVNITGYTLYPFTFSDQVIEEMMAAWKYPVANGNYFVEFDVSSSGVEQFPVGKAVYYMGFSDNSIMGNKLSVFVPAGESENYMFVTDDESEEESYIKYFIREFISDYYHNLSDGRNYPDSFYFYDNVHLITHLMARCSDYANVPPYTIEEISDFITRSFDGNEGVKSVDIDYNVWLHDIVLGEIPADDRIFGCSLAHGISFAEHKVVDVKTDGNSRIYTVNVYADYAYFAPACTLVFYFDVNEGELPKLTMVDLRDNTMREIAVVAV